ncbi:MAG: hypothetical protein IT254_06345 [Chitinophagaceae bacterium]|mgnify:CR=1 FL=1|nr:hypothetical protein [Chitinophagaceae bacterium]MCW5916896.1 hypothetical protein [Ferruginibacter sp.]
MLLKNRRGRYRGRGSSKKDGGGATGTNAKGRTMFCLMVMLALLCAGVDLSREMARAFPVIIAGLTGYKE